jgi:regulator of nucleoside diphosphate kinase
MRGFIYALLADYLIVRVSTRLYNQWKEGRDMRRRIVITEEDMRRLTELVRQGRSGARRDRDHLAELDAELASADVVGAADVAADVVTMHSTVRVRDLDKGISTVYTVVFPVDADVEKNRISVLAPVGTALIGYRAGDLIEWTTPGGTKRLQIEQVLFQPEAAGAVPAAAALEAVR